MKLVVINGHGGLGEPGDVFDLVRDEDGEWGAIDQKSEDKTFYSIDDIILDGIQFSIV